MPEVSLGSNTQPAPRQLAGLRSHAAIGSGDGAPASAEPAQIGPVTCDFIRLDAFKQLCRLWLKQTELHHVVTLNPEMIMAAAHNEQFRDALRAADIRVPDGAGLIWAQWYLRSRFWSLLPSLLAFPFRAVERITGVDAVHFLAALCREQGIGLYLLGGTSTQVVKTADLLRRQFPGLVVNTSPDHHYDPRGPASILDDIHTSQPAVLLVAYGARKQTIWIESHRTDLPSVRIAVGVGGAFAILSEETPRSPRWLRERNLEWLWRLVLEPTRLPRIWRATVQFPLLIKQQKTQHPPTLAAAPPTL